ncbi:hypothetical protein COF68_05210 [Bacillus toyonensis]|uniref:hypothetical protein n=1 Tax=Bacillus toyonensis TaxID=155322 RepID=UPI000BFB73C4|nr:hypothetical protein [Bacillus toyonensis]PHE64243.1 hypothetical protein COF68_05210 [Bacillus toyonensis]
MCKVMDNVKCNWCDNESLVEVGDEFCPQCGREGYLEDIEQEAEVVWSNKESCFVLKEDFEEKESETMKTNNSNEENQFSADKMAILGGDGSEVIENESLAYTTQSRIGKMALLGSELLEVMEERDGVEELEYRLSGKDYWVNSSWIKLFKTKEKV